MRKAEELAAERGITQAQAFEQLLVAREPELSSLVKCARGRAPPCPNFSGPPKAVAAVWRGLARATGVSRCGIELTAPPRHGDDGAGPVT